MIRLIGLALVFSTGCMLGIQCAAKQSSRARRIRTLERMVHDLATQLRYQTPTVRELIGYLRSQPMYETLGFLGEVGEAGRFADAWYSAVKKDPALEREEKQLLAELGGTLGTTDTEGQLCALSLIGAQFSRLAEDTEQKAREKGKLYRAIGILGGAAAAIVLA